MPWRLSRSTSVLGAVTALVTLAACDVGGADGASDGGGDPRSLTVWLTVDARESWPDLVESTNRRFAKLHPGTEVKVQYQQWTSKNQKIDAALAGHDVPDVVEMGNSETINYIVNGAFTSVEKGDFDHSERWLPALADACQYEGKTYCVPYYAGARVGIYRTDLLKRVGVTRAPRTYAEMLSVLDKVKAEFGAADKNFSSFYMPGRYWYAAMAWVKDAGGEMAVERDGRWQGALSSPASVAGLTTWKKLIDDYYVGDRSKDNSDEPGVVGQGKVAMFYGNTWEANAAADPRAGGNAALRGKFATFPFPGPSGELMPPFLGGSLLAVPVKSRQQEKAQEWIKLFTDRASQRRLIEAETLPNNTVQLRDVPAGGINAAAARAAERGWVTPLAPGWTAVEKANILPEMLQSIATGKQSVREAAEEADRAIDKLVNDN
ncbi:extracellular solute-binding protein [Streptomyces clavuligerus]|uniref:extracellular solute-binding protein n=1 Tax=Streptomyces clavuligerus TaxID=1901 RepID=UPI0008104476|nr:extracellular solute-binding protein [Streptomyces clavuligerus]ANW17089.1 sugar ABC transporter substrate-binding protein [Streptomyces clavuligerus]AXU11627.1 extracellular solute-binding protein [Streptomyces clavuligerus]MBY6301461.1 extracellular solute-binding protein [Streptomyces clavuligerus]QPL61748.1 extracellular solute-binding protein [Streptomyces clavuligerus]QPL67781.1 extracellular solute-binding protein [Streptomyces clavuligerus]